jgi:hypothetical protein
MPFNKKRTHLHAGETRRTCSYLCLTTDTVVRNSVNIDAFYDFASFET